MPTPNAPLRALSRRLILAAALAGAAGTSLAQTTGYPSRPVTVVVPFAPGGSVDAAARLTPSEREVLGLVRLGWSNQRIASARERSERTVANQVSALLHKLRAPSRRALAAVQSRL